MRRCVCGAAIRYGSVRCYQCGRIIPDEPEPAVAAVGTAAGASIIADASLMASAPAVAADTGPVAAGAEDNPATATCQMCGAPLATDAAFCHRCGAPRADGGLPAYGLGYRPSPYPYAPGRGAAAGAFKRKSPRLAGFLEFLLAGVGLMYAGAVWQGIAVLVGTLIVAGIASSFTSDAANTSLLLAGLIWAVVRIILAVNAARAHNAHLDDMPPPQ